MAFTTLNLPYYSNNNFQQSHPPHPPHHFRAERPDQDATSHNPPLSSNAYRQVIAASVDNPAPERPTGVTTTAFSPFPEVDERESYTSETGTESEGDEALMERHCKVDESAASFQSPLLQQQVAPNIRTVRDPLETSPEPHSLHSSISEGIQFHQRSVHQLQHQLPPQQTHPQDYSTDLHNPHFHDMQQVQNDDPEIFGRFTSASATPDSQQNVLVTDWNGQDSDAEVEDELKVEGEDLTKPDEDPSCESKGHDSSLPYTNASIQEDRNQTEHPQCKDRNSLEGTGDNVEHIEQEVKDDNISRCSGTPTCSSTREDETVIENANGSEQVLHLTAGNGVVLNKDAPESEGDSSHSERDSKEKIVFQVT